MGEVESHNMVSTFYRITTLSLQVNRPSHSGDTTFSKCDLENSRSRSCHKVGVTSYRVTSLSLHVNQPFHFRDNFFLNLTLKIQGEGEMAMVLLHYRAPSQYKDRLIYVWRFPC